MYIYTIIHVYIFAERQRTLYGHLFINKMMIMSFRFS